MVFLSGASSPIHCSLAWLLLTPPHFRSGPWLAEASGRVPCLWPQQLVLGWDITQLGPRGEKRHLMELLGESISLQLTLILLLFKSLIFCSSWIFALFFFTRSMKTLCTLITEFFWCPLKFCIWGKCLNPLSLALALEGCGAHSCHRYFFFYLRRDLGNEMGPPHGALGGSHGKYIGPRETKSWLFELLDQALPKI